jgi:hypothetical protein
MQLSRALIAVVIIGASAACNDVPERLTSVSPVEGKSPKVRSVFAVAPDLIAAAKTGVRRRGPQDDMLRIEADVPGFGGFTLTALIKLSCT